MLKRTYRTLIFTMLFLVSLFCNGPPAYAWSDSGLGCVKGTKVNLTNFQPTSLYYLGVWNVQVSGAKSGSGKAIFLNEKSDGSGNGYNFIDASNVSTIAQELNGDPTWVSGRVGSITSTISWGTGSQQRIYLRRFTELCGAEVTGYDQGMVYVLTTAKPNGQINPPVTLKAGQSAKISINGSSFVPNSSPYKTITYVFKVNGTQVDSGSGTLSFSKQVSYTFSSAGTYTLTLEITDGVGRKSTITKTVTVSGQPTPPPPNPGGNIPPVADFDMPLSSEVGQSVQIRDQSYDPDGTIVSRTWNVTPNSYTGSLSGTGGTLTFNAKGTYTVTLTVTDNKGATGTASKTIFVGEAPPPPPPPAPQNDPPVARFTMPSRTGPGKTVNVINTSYDPDGYIESVSWQVTPSTGVTKNLGDSGGTLVFSQTGTYTVKLTVVDDFGDSDSYEKEIEVVNQPPVARISMPTEAYQGDDIVIKSTSYDPDGSIAQYTWTVSPSTGMQGTLAGETSTVWFDASGTYTITLKVKDDYGAEATTSGQIVIKPAVPQAFFTDTGVYKQNRKITVTEQGIGSTRYPIDKSADEWRILPVSGGASGDAVRIKQISSDKLEVLFKAAGTYKIGLRVKNTAGNWSDWYEREFAIQPDLPPVADFRVQSAFVRNPDDLSAGEKPTATVDVRDMSYSPDGDIIAHRTWKYRYDSDNDGSFEDESWVVFSNGNELAPSFKTDQVGKYQIELEVTEQFAEETIPEFVTIDDVRMSDTLSKPLEETVTQVANLRPAVSFQVKKKHVVDVVIAEGPKQQIWEFNYTGAPQSVTLPPGTYLFEAWGAGENKSTGYGKGGYTRGKLTLTTTRTFYVYVGGQHSLFNGGGEGGRYQGGTIGGTSDDDSRRGNGATDFRLVGGPWDDITGLRSRIMVAGGGGAGHAYALGQQVGVSRVVGDVGHGGGLVGIAGNWLKDASGSCGDSYAGRNGEPGTQTSGGAGGWLPYNNSYGQSGSFGKGGAGGPGAPVLSGYTWRTGFGGSGGYYGSGGSGGDTGGMWFPSGNSGGSSFISGHPGCNAVNASGIHTGQQNHYSGLVFTETVMQAGVREGNGFARITQLSGNSSNLDVARQALENQLQTAGLDAKVTYCDTTVLDSRSANAEMIFSQWVNFPNGAGNWQLDRTNNVLYSPINPAFETGFYDPNSFNTKNFTMEAAIKANQPTQPMGFLFKLSPKGNGRYKAYFLWLSSDSLTGSKSCITLFKADDYYFSGGPDENTFGNTATPLAIYPDGSTYKYGWPNHLPYDYGGFPHGTPMQKGLTVSNKWDPTIKTTILDFYTMPFISNTSWYKLKVEVVGNLISVYWNGTKVMETYDPDMIPTGAYGFFQFSHVMPMFKDIVITSQSNKTLDEVVKTQTWRENSQKFILDVNSTDYSTTYLNDPSKCGELFNRLLSNNVDLSILGTAANQTSALQMMALNDGNGAFFLQTATNMEPIADYGQYIINKVLGEDTLSNYFLLNEEVYYETYYNDPENDPEYAERWMYEHDPAYFENSLGRADFDQQWLPAPVMRFDKVGKFTTTFQKRDNPKY